MALTIGQVITSGPVEPKGNWLKAAKAILYMLDSQTLVRNAQEYLPPRPRQLPVPMVVYRRLRAQARYPHVQ